MLNKVWCAKKYTYYIIISAFVVHRSACFFESERGYKKLGRHFEMGTNSSPFRLLWIPKELTAKITLTCG